MRLALLLVFATYAGHVTTLAVPLSTILGYGVTAVSLIHKALELSEDLITSDVPLPIIGKRERTLKNSISAVARQIDALERQDMSTAMRTLTILQNGLPQRIALELKLNNLKDYFNRLDIYYNRMKQYTDERAPAARFRRFERYTLENFAGEAIAHNPNSVVSLIERVHEYFKPERKGILNNDIVKPLEHLGDEFPHDINYGLDALQNSWVWARASAEMRTIFVTYEAFRRFQDQQTAVGRIPSPRQAWVDLAETVLNDSKASMPGTMQKLHELKIKENLFLNALREVDGGTLCSIHESPQQMLLNLYNTAVITELKAYAMVQFSYMLLRLYDKGNFTNEAEVMREKFLQRTRETTESMRDALSRASRKLWICDPKKFVKGKNYLEITELLQGYIQNEVDLNDQGTCRENCAEYKYTKSHSCYMNLYCKQQRRCNGKVINCRFVDSDSQVCPAGPGTNRRYDYVEYEDGRVYGHKKGGCARSTAKVDSWWRWLFWHCSYCMCLCDEQGTNSDRYINLRPALTNIEQNKVAVGLRFAKVGRIIYLQIQEGELGKSGSITSKNWVPLESYNITDRNVHNGVDYHTLTFESRALDLDDLETEEQDQVLTGVRFQMLGSHLNFQIRLTSFDFLTGQLQPEKSYWKSNHNTDAARINPRKKLDLERRDIPTRAQSTSQPDSQSDMYLEFTHTDYERDVAQTTIPFFDSQDVVSEIPVPLSGAGIYHKGLPSFGGFVAPKIITYNYNALLENAIDDLDPDKLVN